MAPPSTNSANPTSYQPAARHRPKPPNAVLAEAEQQWIYTEEELDRTPSVVDGMTPENEKEMRSKGTSFITQVGVMLKLPQTTLTTAAVYFNRYLMRRSLVSKNGVKALHHYQIAAICVFLATKVEETCRKMKEIVVAVCRVAQKSPNLLVDEQTKDYWRWRDSILLNEDQLLEAISFDLTIEQPHKHMFAMLQYYGFEHHKHLRTAAWAFINDSNYTQVCVLFTSRTIAAAALYCGAKHCGVNFPDEEGKPWWDVQHVSLREIRRACNYMAGCYEHLPPKEGVENIYVGLRSPVDGAPEHAKTRLNITQTPESVSMERSASSQSLKRGRDDIDGSINEGVNGDVNGREERNGKGEPEAKKIKPTPNGNGNGNIVDNGIGNGTNDATPPEEDGSEEGEVEE